MNQQTALTIKITLDAWYAHVKRVNNLFSNFTDEQLHQDVAPGRNSGIYLLGHLTAVHDMMLPLLGFGEQRFPQLNDIFITSPDKSGKEMPPISDLRNYWNDANAALAEHFGKLEPEEWFQKHTAVSDEDFGKEPHRNRLNVLISRTNHLASHYGQLIFLKK